MTQKELRNIIDNFYQKYDHKYVSPVSLKPDGDSTILFTNSGMFPLVPYLNGQKHPLGKRLYNIQRCLRAEDIEEVGDGRHTTVFEMIGNWSLGDYFKKEQLNMILSDFLINTLKIDINKIYTTVFCGDKNSSKDNESIEILKEIYKKHSIYADIYPIDIIDENVIKEEIDFNKYKIFAYPAKKNWWQRGDAINELGGPDCEIFYDTGKKHDVKYGKYCHPNCDCGRFIEIGNSVFMQYIKKETGWELLSQKNVDFGCGFERLYMILNNKTSVFETDLYMPVFDFITSKTNIKYHDNKETDIYLEIIADHIKAAVFIIADEIIPSNKEQGYILRRLIRRAIRYSKKIGLDTNFIENIASIFIEIYKDFYKDIFIKEKILPILKNEVFKFEKTINNGLKEFDKMIQKKDDKIISGEKAFYFFETYGFPIEMYLEELDKNNIKYDKNNIIDEFNKAKNKHADLSRTTSIGMFKSGLADNNVQTTKYHTATHILLAALRAVLSKDIVQKGSNITSERLRLDFNYNEKITEEKIKEIENLVNNVINQALEIKRYEIPYKEAILKGYIGIYKPSDENEIVSVYEIGDFSKEICSGPHVKNTSELGNFKIIKEESIGNGIRRIKAILV